MSRIRSTDALALVRGWIVLVAEDDYIQAKEICRSLTNAGAVVVGPFASVGDGSAAIAGGRHLDVALLDIDLRGERVYRLADALRARGVPLIFLTGYEQAALPTVYQDVPICDKPLDFCDVARHLAELPTRA